MSPPPPFGRRALRLFILRPAFTSGLVVSVVVSAALMSTLRPVTAVLVGWDAGVCAYLIISARYMIGATPAKLRARAAQLDEGNWGILATTIAGGLAALVAIFVHLASPRGDGDFAARAIFAGGTVLLSWFYVHVAFAQHYAHLWYDCKGGLEFPGPKREPTASDFLYVAFTVGMTFQVSDVAVTDPRLRRLVLVHGLVGFAFTTVILALSINFAASLAQPGQ